MRLFVAVDLTDAAKEAIAAYQKRIADALSKSREALRLVKPAHMHLTLLFLGEVEEARVPAFIESMNVDAKVAPFEMAFGGLGVFPARGAPRVLWMGVTQGAESLTRLQAEIAERARALGLTIDDRTFNAHLTLGRWRASRSSDRAKALAAAQRGNIARVHVDCATLYQSRLSPAGSTYTPLARVTLTDVGIGD